MRRLSAKQARFVVEYMVDLNATQAAIRSGYSAQCARSIASENLTKPKIAAAIQQAAAARTSLAQAEADRVLIGLARIAFFDPRTLFDADGFPKAIVDLDSQTAAALASFEIATESLSAGSHATTTFRCYKLVDKGVALEKLAKHLGLYEQSRKSPQDALAEIS